MTLYAPIHTTWNCTKLCKYTFPTNTEHIGSRGRLEDLKENQIVTPITSFLPPNTAKFSLHLNLAENSSRFLLSSRTPQVLVFTNHTSHSSPRTQTSSANSPPGTNHSRFTNSGNRTECGTCGTLHKETQIAMSKELSTEMKQMAQGLELLAESQCTLGTTALDNCIALDYLLAVKMGVCLCLCISSHILLHVSHNTYHVLKIARDMYQRSHNVTLLTKLIEQVKIFSFSDLFS